MAVNCNEGTLSIYIPDQNNPWDISKVLFLFRRLGFSIKFTDVKNQLNTNPNDLIDQLFDEAVNMPVSPDPGWANFNNADFTASGKNRGAFFRDHQKIVFDDFLNNGLRERLTLFWSNHFVTEYYMYSHPAYTFRYYNNLQQYALGNFKEFVRIIGLDDAMLMYLNGYDNKNNAPNENYSRELYELFTLGEGNGYTQDDITETSRALTGYNTRQNGGPITFNPNRFDDGEKTIFGRTGNWGYDDVIDILFEEKSDLIATFICTKIYKHFVSPVINDQIISELSSDFIQNNFELLPIFKKLFKSEHFFNSDASNVIIKSPIDLMVFIEKEFDFIKPNNFTSSLTNYLRARTMDMGQQVLNPIDVAGWQENQDWISTGTLPMRWEFGDYLLNRYYVGNKDQFRTLLKEMIGENNNNPESIVRIVKEYMFCNYEILEDELNDAISIFKGDIPDNYFDGGEWSIEDSTVPKQFYDLLRFFVTLPEFQLK
tara:strand:+ start:109 stop:1563 length:1455 start_codon:yes stop_codon:yes gene_type:complete